MVHEDKLKVFEIEKTNILVLEHSPVKYSDSVSAREQTFFRHVLSDLPELPDLTNRNTECPVTPDFQMNVTNISVYVRLI